MKIYIYCDLFIWWAPKPLHEIIKKHLNHADEIILLCCDAGIIACTHVLPYDISCCLNCIGTVRRYLKNWPGKVSAKSILNLSREDKKKLEETANRFLTSHSIEEWEKFKIENFDIGYAVLSTLISLLGEPRPDLRQNRDLLKKLLISSLVIHYSIRNHLNHCPVDRVYVFNGRFATSRAILRACQMKGVDCFTTDHGCAKTHYMVYANTLPHDINYNKKMIQEHWHSSKITDDDKKKIASAYFSDRASRIAQDAYQNMYTDNQTLELMPQNWDTSKINVAIFCSSDDEYAAIGKDWKSPVYPSQIEGIRQIVEALAQDKNLHIYLRVHPHLKGVKNSQTKEINLLRAPNLTVIPAGSPVSSYALMRQASKVLTFGSTAGIEAAFFGIPSILAGQSFYYDLESTYNPKTHEELITLLRGILAPKDKTGALIYGYFLSTFGYRYEYFEKTKYFDDTSGELLIKPTFVIRVIRRLLKTRYGPLLKQILTPLWVYYASRRICR